MAEWRGMVGGRLKEKGVGVGKETKNHPLSLIPYPQVFSATRPESGEGFVLVGEGDVKATDFLTSLAALAPRLQPLHLGSQGWG